MKKILLFVMGAILFGCGDDEDVDLELTVKCSGSGCDNIFLGLENEEGEKFRSLKSGTNTLHVKHVNDCYYIIYADDSKNESVVPEGIPPVCTDESFFQNGCFIQMKIEEHIVYIEVKEFDSVCLSAVAGGGEG